MCVPGVIGSMTGSNPVGQGSSPWGHAFSARPTSRGARFFSKSLVPWSNGYDTCLTNRKRWFDSIQDYLRLDTPIGRAVQLGHRPKVGRRMFAGSTPALGTFEYGVRSAEFGMFRFIPHSEFHIPHLFRLGRQLADHLGLEPGMLWVRLPPEPFP